MEGQLLNTASTAEFLGIRPQTLRLWRHRGSGPCYIRLGGRYGRVLYDRDELLRWLAQRTYQSTSQEAAREAISRDPI